MRCRIDTWARACVPVRRLQVRPKTKAMSETPRYGNTLSNRASKKVGSRSPTRINGGNKMVLPSTPSGGSRGGEEADKGKQGARGEQGQAGMISLEEDVVQDEEEAAMREMKEREAKRKREEENRIQRKVSEEAEEIARLAQVKDQMKNKPYTYDSSGAIIWVQALAAEKLPNPNPVPGYVLRREVASTEQYSLADKPSPRGSLTKALPMPMTSIGKKAKGKNKHGDAEFTDTFKKFSSQQPPMMESMKMAPGCILHERGGFKAGEEIGSRDRNNTAMTRRDYQNLVQNGGQGYPDKDKEEGKDDKEVSAPASNTQSQQQLPAIATGEAGAAGEQRPADVHKDPTNRNAAMKVAPVSQSAGFTPHAPAMPRPEQPVPPPSMRRVQMKRDALGYNMSTRERVPTGTGSRFPGCAAKPVLGAVMGHGLVPQGSKYEEYYFPNAAGLPLGLGLGDEDVIASPRGSSGMPTPRAKDGQIISKNPELVKRLFNR